MAIVKSSSKAEPRRSSALPPRAPSSSTFASSSSSSSSSLSSSSFSASPSTSKGVSASPSSFLYPASTLVSPAALRRSSQRGQTVDELSISARSLSPFIPSGHYAHIQRAREEARKKKQCNCRRSNCLKLYCECFAAGVHCDSNSCHCVGCFNNRNNEATRRKAVQSTLERNPAAFRPKIAASPQVGDIGGKHHKGCNCKKSNCLKKYCECFQAGVTCSEMCKCRECKNYEGSSELIATLQAAEGGGGAGVGGVGGDVGAVGAAADLLGGSSGSLTPGKGEVGAGTPGGAGGRGEAGALSHRAALAKARAKLYLLQAEGGGHPHGLDVAGGDVSAGPSWMGSGPRRSSFKRGRPGSNYQFISDSSYTYFPSTESPPASSSSSPKSADSPSLQQSLYSSLSYPRRQRQSDYRNARSQKAALEGTRAAPAPSPAPPRSLSSSSKSSSKVKQEKEARGKEVRGSAPSADSPSVSVPLPPSASPSRLEDVLRQETLENLCSVLILSAAHAAAEEEPDTAEQQQSPQARLKQPPTTNTATTTSSASASMRRKQIRMGLKNVNASLTDRASSEASDGLGGRNTTASGEERSSSDSAPSAAGEDELTLLCDDEDLEEEHGGDDAEEDFDSSHKDVGERMASRKRLFEDGDSVQGSGRGDSSAWARQRLSEGSSATTLKGVSAAAAGGALTSSSATETEAALGTSRKLTAAIEREVLQEFSASLRRIAAMCAANR